MFHTLAFCCLCCWHLVGLFGETDAVKSVSVMEGDSVTLNSSLTEIQTDDKIVWTFGTNRSLIARINRVTKKILDVPDGIFRDRLKLDSQTGSLTIMNTRTTDSGLYEVTISNSSTETKYRFTVTVYGPVSLIVLIFVAAGFLLIVAAVGMFWICRKHRKTDQEVQTRTEEIIYTDPSFYKRNPQRASVKQEDDAVYASVVQKR